MITVVRIVCGIVFGAAAIFFLFLGVVGIRGGHAGAGVVLCLAAIAGAIAYYLLSLRPEKTRRRQRMPSREIAMPEQEDARRTHTTGRRPVPASEGWRKLVDPNSWDFDIATVTPAGWIFGVTSCLIIFGGMGFLFSSFGVTRLNVPRSVIRLFGVFLLAPVIAYFIYGAKVMKSLGYPVFRGDRATPPRDPRSQRRKGARGGAPAGRTPPPGLPPRRQS